MTPSHKPITEDELKRMEQLNLPGDKERLIAEVRRLRERLAHHAQSTSPGDQLRCTDCRKVFTHGEGTYSLVCPHCKHGQMLGMCRHVGCEIDTPHPVHLLE